MPQVAAVVSAIAGVAGVAAGADASRRQKNQARDAARAAEQQAQQASKQAEMETNRANQRTANAAASAMPNQGLGGTMLTGPQGVDPNALSLGPNRALIRMRFRWAATPCWGNKPWLTAST